MNDFLDMQIGPKLRKVKVVNITKEEVNMSTGRSEKVYFSVKDEASGREYKISDSYVRDHENNLRIQGLWFPRTTDPEGQPVLSPQSSLAKLLEHYGVKSLRDLINKDVHVCPDKKDFLVLTACDISDDELESTGSNQEEKKDKPLFPDED